MHDEEREEAKEFRDLQPSLQCLNTTQLAEGFFDGMVAHELGDASDAELAMVRQGVLVLGEREQGREASCLENGSFIAWEPRGGNGKEGPGGIFTQRPDLWVRG